MPTCSRCSRPAASASASIGTWSAIARAARTAARSLSASARGAPNTVISPSPLNSTTDAAAVRDDLRHELGVGGHGAEDRRRPLALGERGVAAQVDEQHRDLALAGLEVGARRELARDRARHVRAQALHQLARLALGVLAVEAQQLVGGLVAEALEQRAVGGGEDVARALAAQTGERRELAARQDRHGELDPHRRERRALGGIVVAPGDERLERRGARRQRRRRAARRARTPGSPRARARTRARRRCSRARRSPMVTSCRIAAIRSPSSDSTSAPLAHSDSSRRSRCASSARMRRSGYTRSWIARSMRRRIANAAPPIATDKRRLTHLGIDPLLRGRRHLRHREEAERDQPDPDHRRDRRPGDQPVDVEQVEACERDQETDGQGDREHERRFVQPPQRRHGDRRGARERCGREPDPESDQHPLQLAAPDRPAGAVALHEPRAEHRDGRDLQR